MGTTYHQFCPVAKAMELLDERWTMLIVRELVAGSSRFNEVRRGVPRYAGPPLPWPPGWSRIWTGGSALVRSGFHGNAAATPSDAMR